MELSNETNAAHEQGRSLVKRTKLVEKDNLSWDEDFYYNNNVILDDNITFVLRAEDHRELGRNMVRNLSLLRKKKEAQPDLGNDAPTQRRRSSPSSSRTSRCVWPRSTSR